jgi:hypothetical protein
MTGTVLKSGTKGKNVQSEVYQTGTSNSFSSKGLWSKKSSESNKKSFKKHGFYL